MYRAPVSLPGDIEGLRRVLLEELSKVERSSLDAVDFIRLKELHVEPARVYEDLVVRADGSDWNPGSGAGYYGRSGAAWVKLNV